MKKLNKTKQKSKAANKSSIDNVFEKHRFQIKLNKYNKNKLKIFTLGIVSSLFFIVCIYFLLPISNIKGYSINGNYFIDENYILKKAGISENSKYLLIFNSLIENKINEIELVEDVIIEITNDKIVNITISEKLVVGYRFDEKFPQIVVADGSLIEIQDYYTNIISKVPLIVDFKDDIVRFAQSFVNVEQNMIESISEIQRYEYTFDPNGIQCFMKDGNRLFMSYYSADLLNKYNGISSANKTENACIYIDEYSKNAYTSLCPEQQAALDKELEDDLLDEDGEKKDENGGEKDKENDEKE